MMSRPVNMILKSAFLMSIFPWFISAPMLIKMLRIMLLATLQFNKNKAPYGALFFIAD